MTDNLRDRIIAALLSEDDVALMADAVIRELGQRQCERCRHYKPADHFPMPHAGGDRMRPFCIPCAEYIEWATS